MDFKASTSAAAAAALAVLQKYGAPKNNKHYAYGTAGFRFEVDDYSRQVFARTGMLAYFRSCFLGGKTVGLCITASHNLGQDNGVKLIDPDGGMLSQTWEKLATDVINAPSNEECIRLLLNTCEPSANRSSVLLARDTRLSSEELERCAMEGISAWSAGAGESIGLATTPQLHYCVMERNQHGFVKGYAPTLQGYNQLVCQAYEDLVRETTEGQSLAVDCSNGIGGLRFAPIAARLQGVVATLFNVDDVTKLNLQCGAEFVQKGQIPPANLPKNIASNSFASFDGDADRVVCYYFDANARFRLLDGDKIASLFAFFIKRQLDEMNLSTRDVTLGTVQTAYANGSSTAFLREKLEVSVPIVKTGVKHLHHAAHEFDIGIYFEANGHGTVLFRPSFIARMQQTPPCLAQKRLMAFILLLNQATGDAIADLLAVHAVLRVLDMDFAKWDQLYADLPSKQSKVRVLDRNLVEVNEDETRCTSPVELQRALDDAVQNAGKQARVFVRPSGTENVIRVYAEAKTQADADALAEAARLAICRYAGGLSE